MKKKILSVAITCAAFPLAVLAADVTYRGEIRPLLKAQCDECHGNDAPQLAEFKTNEEKFKKEKLGPRTTTYGDLIALVGWPDTGALMRRLDDGKSSADGKPGNMYKQLGENETERQKNLAVFKAWVGEGAWKLNRWEKRGEVAAITKEEVDKLKLKY
jgi:hypothetical protein